MGPILSWLRGETMNANDDIEKQASVDKNTKHVQKGKGKNAMNKPKLVENNEKVTANSRATNLGKKEKNRKEKNNLPTKVENRSGYHSIKSIEQTEEGGINAKCIKRDRKKAKTGLLQDHTCIDEAVIENPDQMIDEGYTQVTASKGKNEIAKNNKQVNAEPMQVDTYTDESVTKKTDQMIEDVEQVTTGSRDENQRKGGKNKKAKNSPPSNVENKSNKHVNKLSKQAEEGSTDAKRLKKDDKKAKTELIQDPICPDGELSKQIDQIIEDTKPVHTCNQHVDPIQVHEVEQRIKPNEPPISELVSIEKAIDKLEEEVDAFKGPRRDKEYIYLEEMLTRYLLQLDNIEVEGDGNLRLERRKLIKRIQDIFEKHEEKADLYEKANSLPAKSKKGKDT